MAEDQFRLGTRSMTSWKCCCPAALRNSPPITEMDDGTSVSGTSPRRLAVTTISSISSSGWATTPGGAASSTPNAGARICCLMDFMDLTSMRPGYVGGNQVSPIPTPARTGSGSKGSLLRLRPGRCCDPCPGHPLGIRRGQSSPVGQYTQIDESCQVNQLPGAG